uniref:Uncharacterized protein n=1 Tax=Ixodes ricinus TaxID=34613 RepID=A0A6B0TXH5_IXORI
MPACTLKIAALWEAITQSLGQYGYGDGPGMCAWNDRAPPCGRLRTEREKRPPGATGGARRHISEAKRQSYRKDFGTHH